MSSTRSYVCLHFHKSSGLLFLVCPFRFPAFAISLGCVNGGFPGGLDGKASACTVGDPGSNPGWGRSPGEGNDNPLQYSCLENSMDCSLPGSQRAGHDWATSLSLWASDSSWLLVRDLVSRDTVGKAGGGGCSVAKSCLSVCDPMDYSTSGFPVLHCLPNSCPLSQWCYPTISFSAASFSFNPSSIRVFSSELALCIRWPKYWSFSISPSNEYSRLISFRIDWLISLQSKRDSQESSPIPQFESVSSLAFSLLYGQTLTAVHDYWKTMFDWTDLYQQREGWGFW